MIETKIKPCPFCGSEVFVTRGTIQAPFYFFKCKSTKCGAVISFDNALANFEPIKALENWNERKNEEL